MQVVFCTQTHVEHSKQRATCKDMPPQSQGPGCGAQEGLHAVRTWEEPHLACGEAFSVLYMKIDQVRLDWKFFVHWQNGKYPMVRVLIQTDFKKISNENGTVEDTSSVFEILSQKITLYKCVCVCMCVCVCVLITD